MATKPRHQKTPTQLWVADNRKRLGLTSLDLARATGVTEATARGWESRGSPSQDAMDVLVRTFGVPAPDSTASPTVDASGLAALIEQQATAQWQTAEAIRELVGVLREALGQPAPDPLVEEALAAVAERDPQFGRPRPQSTSQPRKRDRGRLAEERRRESRQGEAT